MFRDFRTHTPQEGRGLKGRLLDPSVRWQLLAVFFLAIVLRTAVTIYTGAYHPGEARGHWEFGYEAGRLAYSLATGQGFSSPMPEPTGPSAFLAPAYPFFVSCVFRVFGVYSEASAIAILAIDIVISAITCIALYLLGEQLFGRMTGLIAAYAFAVFPPSIYQAGTNIFEATLTAFAVVVLLNMLFSLPEVPTSRDCIVVGLAMAATIYINYPPAVFYPAAVVWIGLRAWHTGAGAAQALKAPALLSVVCLLAFSPWMIRNRIQVGTWLRPSGIQLILGNNEKAWERHGDWNEDIYAPNSPEEMRLYQQMGELAYDAYCKQRALHFIHENPDKFRDLIFFRMAEWWLGTSNADRKGRGAAAYRLMVIGLITAAGIGLVFAFRAQKRVGLLLAIVLIYPIPYYIFHVMGRYRFPIESIFVLLASFAAVTFGDWVKGSSKLDFSSVISSSDTWPETRKLPRANRGRASCPGD